MKRKKNFVSLVILALVIVGSCSLPGQANDSGPPELKLTLEEAVATAMENNPQIGIAKADREKKEIAYRQARDASQKIEDMPDYTPLGPSGKNSYESNKVRYLVPKIAERQGEQAEKVYEVTVNGIKVQVEKAFYDLVQAREKQEIAENALKRADEQLRIAQLRFEVGSATKIEVLKAEAGQAAAQAALQVARNEYKQKMLELNKVLGIDLNTVVDPQGEFEFVKEEYDLEGLLNTAMEEDISVIKACDAYEIAKWTCDFDQSIYANTWEARKNRQDMIAAELYLQQAQDDLVTRVHKAYSGYLALEEQYEYLLKTVELQKEAYELTRLSYEVGVATLTEVQEASDAVKEAEADLLNCIHQYNMLKSSFKYSVF